MIVSLDAIAAASRTIKFASLLLSPRVPRIYQSWFYYLSFFIIQSRKKNGIRFIYRYFNIISIILISPKAQTDLPSKNRWSNRRGSDGGIKPVEQYISILAYEEKTIRREEEKEMDRERKDSKGSRVSRCKCVRAMHLSPLGVHAHAFFCTQHACEWVRNSARVRASATRTRVSPQRRTSWCTQRRCIAIYDIYI